MIPSTNAEPAENGIESLDYVTVMIGEQMLGLPIRRVHDVFITHAITLVPTAPPEIVGLINLRGRVVTAICLRRRLGRPAEQRQDRRGNVEWVAIGIDHGRESYALIVDAVGEVLRLPPSTLEPAPAHLDPLWAAVATGVHRLHDRLLVALDVDALMDFGIPAAA
jgi:purine-binding chemotaxis protein CheW